MSRSLRQQDEAINCDSCGVDATTNWESGPGLTKLCPDCATEAWDDYDIERSEDKGKTS